MNICSLTPKFHCYANYDNEKFWNGKILNFQNRINLGLMDYNLQKNRYLH